MNPTFSWFSGLRCVKEITGLNWMQILDQNVLFYFNVLSFNKFDTQRQKNEIERFRRREGRAN